MHAMRTAVLVAALLVGCSKTSSPAPTPPLFPQDYAYLELGQPFDTVVSSLLADSKVQAAGLHISFEVGGEYVEADLPKDARAAQAACTRLVEVATAKARQVSPTSDRAAEAIRRHENTNLSFSPGGTIRRVEFGFSEGRLHNASFVLEAEGALARNQVLKDLSVKFGPQTESNKGLVTYTAWHRCSESAKVWLHEEGTDPSQALLTLHVARLPDDERRLCAATPKL